MTTSHTSPHATFMAVQQLKENLETLSPAALRATLIELGVIDTSERLTSKYTNDKSKLITEVIDQFDFKKVHNVMKMFNWSWASVGVPSVEDLRAKAIYLLECALNQGGVVATGGLEANYCTEDEWLELKFVVEFAYAAVDEV